jgi:hypothetical protein
VFGEAKINLEYAYAFVTRDQKAILIVRVDDIEATIKTLEEENIKLIDMKELEKI